MSGAIMMIMTMVATLVLMAVGFLVLVSFLYRKAPEGFALIRNGLGGPQASTTGMMVIPVLHSCNLLGTTLQKIDHSVILKDKESEEISVDISLYIKPNAINMEELLMAHKQVGSDGLAESGTMTELVRDKVEQAACMVAGTFTSQEIHQQNFEVTNMVVEIVGDAFPGFVLEDVSVKPAS